MQKFVEKTVYHISLLNEVENYSLLKIFKSSFEKPINGGGYSKLINNQPLKSSQMRIVASTNFCDLSVIYLIVTGISKYQKVDIVDKNVQLLLDLI